MLVCLIPRKSVCDCSEFNSSLIVRMDSPLFPWQLFDQRADNSLDRAADVSSTHLSSSIGKNLRSRIPLEYSHTVFQYAMIDVALRKRPLFAEILFRLSGVEPS